MSDAQTVQILADIWAKIPEEKRFAAYGGTVENAVMDAPGALDMNNTEELSAAYLIPNAQLSNIDEGASLVHMMNSNIFTAISVHLTDGAQVEAFYTAWRDAVQGNRWICGQPDKLMFAQIDEAYLIMAFGSTDAMSAFSTALSAAYGNAQVLYNESVVS